MSIFALLASLAGATPSLNGCGYRASEFCLLHKTGCHEAPFLAVNCTGGKSHSGSVLLFSLPDGKLVPTVVSSMDKNEFAVELCAISDLDGDGIEDLAISSTAGAPEGEGGIELFGSKDRTLLRRIDTGRRVLACDEQLAFLSSAKGDRLLVRSTLHSKSDGDHGYLAAFSVSPGTKLWEQEIDTDFYCIESGDGIAVLSDIDGDGVLDFGYRAWHRVVFVSGSFLHEISSIQQPEEANSFGRTMASIADVDGDGVTDIAIGAPYMSLGNNKSGALYLVSPKSGKVIWCVPGAKVRSGMGRSVRRVPDCDGDGLADIVVSRQDFCDEGVEILSSKTGKRIREMHHDGHGIDQTIGWKLEVLDAGTLDASRIFCARFKPYAPGPDDRKVVIFELTTGRELDALPK